MVDVYKEYALICANGCGQAHIDVQVHQPNLDYDDKSIYCKGCDGDIWYAIPKEVE